jgi:hypothetical protein
MSQVYTAALLTAHGYPSLSVAGFDWPGLPGQLERVPLEYFEAAGRILAAQTGTDPAHVLALGYSRGSEAALLAADYFPRCSTARSWTRHRRSPAPRRTTRASPPGR